MLPSQQVISKIETAQNIKAGSGDTDGCNGVVVHAEILRISETLNLTLPGHADVRPLFGRFEDKGNLGRTQSLEFLILF